MKIVTTGDSHSKAGWEDIRMEGVEIVINYLGAPLMYSFGRDYPNIVSKCMPFDVVVFCTGEIDMRCHIYKHSTTSEGRDTIIDDMVMSYFKAIEMNVNGLKGVTTSVYNVVPPTRQATLLPEIRFYFPFVGSDEQRREATLYINDKLRAGCAERGYVFFDIYDKCTDEDGLLSPEVTAVWDGVHVRKCSLFMDFIKNHFLK